MELFEHIKVFDIDVGDNVNIHNTVRTITEERDTEGKRYRVFNKGCRDEWQAYLGEDVRVYKKYRV